MTLVLRGCVGLEVEVSILNELLSYQFLKYMQFVAGVDLARSPLHKLRREILKNEA